MPTTTADEQKAFWQTLMDELPAFIDFLINWQVPDALRSERYGIREFHHPAIVEALGEDQPESRLLSILNEVLFPRCSDAPAYFQGNIVERPIRTWEGPAEDLEARITDRECKLNNEF